MCCESCPKYEDCAIHNRLKENCCDVCPDYEDCYPEGSEEHEEEDQDEGSW